MSPENYVSFCDHIVRTLCAFPENVDVTKKTDDRGVLLEVALHPDDYGRVIGKNGSTISAIRQLVRAAAASEHARASVLLVGDPRGQRTFKEQY